LLELASWQHGKGLAREAAQHLENLVAVHGYQRIGLNVLTSNPVPWAFGRVWATSARKACEAPD